MKQLCLSTIALLTCFGLLAKASPVTYQVNVKAPGILDNPTDACHLVGSIKVWATRPTTILDVTGVKLGVVDASLVQFEKGSRLEACAPGTYVTPHGTALNLAGQFMVMLSADGRAFDDMKFDSREAAHDAYLLTTEYYKLQDSYGAIVPLTHMDTDRLIGSEAYQFTAVLIKGPNNKFGIVVHRETTKTKFADEVDEQQRRETALDWSTVNF